MRFFFFVFVRYIYMVVILKRRCFGMIHRKKEGISFPEQWQFVRECWQVPGPFKRLLSSEVYSTKRCYLQVFNGIFPWSWRSMVWCKIKTCNLLSSYTHIYTDICQFADVCRGNSESQRIHHFLCILRRSFYHFETWIGTHGPLDPCTTKAWIVVSPTAGCPGFWSMRKLPRALSTTEFRWRILLRCLGGWSFGITTRMCWPE